MSLVVCDNSPRHRDRDERRLFEGGSAIVAGAKVRIGARASERILKRWKMRMPSFRLERLGSLARGTAVLEKVEQLGDSNATALEEWAELGIPDAVVGPVVEESPLAGWCGRWSREVQVRSCLVRAEDHELKTGVWRGEGLERGNIWAFSRP